MAHDVFISHSSKDKSIADAVCAVLEREGIRCWIAPRDIRPGTDWGHSVIQGIKASRAMVLVLSRAANTSPPVLREVERAVHLGLPVLPIRIEDVLPEGALEFHLGTVHWLDAVTPPLEAHLTRLAETLTAVLRDGRGTAQASRTPVADSEAAGEAPGQPGEPARSPDKPAEKHQHPQTARPGVLWTAARVVLTIFSALLALMLFGGLSFQVLSSQNQLMFMLGITFGPVVLLWRYPRPQDVDRLRGPVFLAVSLTSAVLAFPTTELLTDSRSVVDQLVPTVGAIYLAFGHKFVLGASGRQVAWAILGATALYHVGVRVMGNLFVWFLSWQVGYLLGIFGVLESALDRVRGRRSSGVLDLSWGRTQYVQFLGLVIVMTVGVYALILALEKAEAVRRTAKAEFEQAELFRHAERSIRVPGGDAINTSIGGFTISSYEVLPEHTSVVYRSLDGTRLEHTIARRDTEVSAQAHCLSFLPTWRDSETRLALQDLPVPLTDGEGQVVGSITQLHDAGGQVAGFTRRVSGREELYWTNGSYCLGVEGQEGDAVRFQRLLGY
jgi:hypothetical protein